VKVIIAGTRHWESDNRQEVLDKCVEESGFIITEVVSGMATGVDTEGCIYAKRHNIPVKEFPANWKEHGRSAGPRRNKEMGEYADTLIALPNKLRSMGTNGMIKIMDDLGKPTYVHPI